MKRGTGLLMSIVLLASLVASGGGPVSAQAASCTEYEFIAARGSGESANLAELNMGTLMFSTFQQLQAKAGSHSLRGYGVEYPAVGLTSSISDALNGLGAVLHIKPLGAYTDSVREGTRSTLARVAATHASCPGTRFILGGYSQGAQAVGDALQQLSSVDLSTVAAAVFYGDPYFNARSSSGRSTFSPDYYGALGVRAEWPGVLDGRVFSYCHDSDPVCNLSQKVHIFGTSADVYVRNPLRLDFGNHTNYLSTGDDKLAAKDVALALGWTGGVKSTPPLDLMFVIDTTGSMGGVIGSVRSNVLALANQLAVSAPDHRFGLVDYKDYGDVYQARLDVGFTADVSALQTGVNALVASGGGDLPESVYAGIMKAFEQPWRQGVKKVAIVIGDAPPKDPEPGTGYTALTVINRSFAIDPAAIFTLQYGSYGPTADAFRQLSTATGGGFQAATNLTDFQNVLLDAIRNVAAGPLAQMPTNYAAVAGLPVTFSAATSTPGDAPIKTYEWDFDGDGVVDQITTAPTVEHVFATAGMANLRVKAVDAAGLGSFASTVVSVAVAPTVTPPSAVQNLGAASSTTSVVLTWQTGPGGPPLFFVIADAAGAIVDVVAARPDGSAPTSWTDPELTPGSALTYRVSAGNLAGLGPASSISFVVGNVPTSIAGCQRDGWRTRVRKDGTAFKNQGDCIQYVNTGK